MTSEVMHNLEFQRQVINLVATDLQFAMAYSNDIRDSYFETSNLRILFRTLRDEVTKYEKEITLSEAKAALNNLCENKDYDKSVETELRQELTIIMERTVINSRERIIDNMLSFMRRQELKLALMKSIEILESNQNFSEVLHVVDRAVSVGLGKKKGLNFHDLEKIQDIYLSEHSLDQLIPTGLPTLDRAIEGGLAPKEIFTLIGAPKCFDGETEIPLLNGERIKIKDFEHLKEAWIYAYDLDQKDVVAAKAYFAVKRKSNNNLKVTLDNGYEVICTSDHQWLLSNGQYVEAKDLQISDSVMSCQWKKKKRGRHMIRTTTSEYRYTHRMAASVHGSVDNMDVHHIDGNPSNNSPDNLLVCTHAHHQKIHSSERYPQMREKLRNGLKKFFESERGIEHLRQNSIRITALNKTESQKQISLKNLEIMRQKNKERKLNNHKVSKIEEIPGERWVYDISVPDLNNFAIYAGKTPAGPFKIDSGVFVHNCGKTSAMISMACAALRHNKSVFHVSLESKQIDVALKYAMNLTQMTKQEILNDPTTYTERYHRMKAFNDRLFINHWPEKSINTHTIRGWISRVRAETGTNVDLIVCDYDAPVIASTKIPLLDGTEHKIEDLVGKGEMWVYSCTPEGKIVPGRSLGAVLAGHTNRLIKITLDNGEEITSTIDHKHMLRDGTYEEAQNLKPGDSMMPLYKTDNEVLDNESGQYIKINSLTNSSDQRKTRQCKYCQADVIGTIGDLTRHRNVCYKNPHYLEKKDRRERPCKYCGQTHFGDFWEARTQIERCRSRIRRNHKIVSVELIKLDEPVPVYCMTVEKYHNFALSAGIFTHNCLLPSSQKDSMYEQSGAIYVDLIQLADAFNCPIITASQPKVDWWDAAERGKVVTAAAMAESSQKAHKTYFAMSLNFVPGEDQGVAYLDIARRGEGFQRINVKRDWSRCTLIEQEPDQGLSLK